MQSAQVKLQARLAVSDTFLDYVPSSVDERPALANVKLVTVSGDVVWAHSCILSARSLYFRSLLRADQAEHEIPELPVKAKAILSVLRYLYMDIVHFDTENVESLRELFFLAKKWKLFMLEALFGRTIATDVPATTRITSLCHDLGAMLQDATEESCDVILQVEERRFPAHRLVLVAQSDFFRSLFTMGWKESGVAGQKKVIPLGNVTADDFAALLHFAYTHRFPSSHERLEDLMRLIPAANYFAFAALSDGVAAWVSNVVELSYGNCASVWQMAVTSNFRGLEAKCCEFVQVHYEDFPLASFYSLPRDLLHRALEQGELDLEEDAICEKLIRWGYAQLGRPQLRNTSRVRIANDAELQRVLSGLLPPSVLMTKRNKMALLGYSPFSLQELIV